MKIEQIIKKLVSHGWQEKEKILQKQDMVIYKDDLYENITLSGLIGVWKGRKLILVDFSDFLEGGF